jgi:hypothetical protein
MLEHASFGDFRFAQVYQLNFLCFSFTLMLLFGPKSREFVSFVVFPLNFMF